MIDPTQITNFNRTEAELQEFWIFCLVVAGKTAKVQARLLEGFLQGRKPFELISEYISQGILLDKLKESRLGQFTKLTKAFTQSLALNLTTCSSADLEAIYGVGPKTARFFLLHSRKNVRVAVLDTHMMKHMKALGYDVPKGSPSGKKYLELELEYLDLADKSGKSLAAYDLDVWNSYAK